MAYDMPKEGTRRLQLVLGIGGFVACAVALAVVLILHGGPTWHGWWGVMAVLLVLGYFLPRAIVPVLEWVIAGYKG
jgi:hypothetical protein